MLIFHYYKTMKLILCTVPVRPSALQWPNLISSFLVCKFFAHFSWRSPKSSVDPWTNAGIWNQLSRSRSDAQITCRPVCSLLFPPSPTWWLVYATRARFPDCRQARTGGRSEMVALVLSPRRFCQRLLQEWVWSTGSLVFGSSGRLRKWTPLGRRKVGVVSWSHIKNVIITGISCSSLARSNRG